MADPAFRLVAVASALLDAPPDWARELMADGELAVLPGGGELSAVSDVAHRLDVTSVPVLRAESTPDAQADTVIAWADGMPLVWIDAEFPERVRDWARDRGPMTLLVTCAGELPADEQRRIARFAGTLGRQSE
jgi:hypothetical protein